MKSQVKCRSAAPGRGAANYNRRESALNWLARGGQAPASGCGVPEQWEKDGCPHAVLSFAPGQESQGSTVLLPSRTSPDPRAACDGAQMLLTLEPTGQAGDPIGPARPHAALSLMPPATLALLEATLCLPCHRKGPHSRRETLNPSQPQLPKSPGDAASPGVLLRKRSEGRRAMRKESQEKPFGAGLPPPSPPPQLELPGAIRLPSLGSRLVTARPPAPANQGR